MERAIIKIQMQYSYFHPCKCGKYNVVELGGQGTSPKKRENSGLLYTGAIKTWIYNCIYSIWQVYDNIKYFLQHTHAVYIAPNFQTYIVCSYVRTVISFYNLI